MIRRHRRATPAPRSFRRRDGRRSSSSTASPPSAPDSVPTWRTWRQACRVVARRDHLRATTRIALLVGTVLFAINHLDVVLAGDATTATWAKSGATYGVPFVVSNLGILTATRRRS